MTMAFGAAEAKHLRVATHKHNPVPRVDAGRAEPTLFNSHREDVEVELQRRAAAVAAAPLAVDVPVAFNAVEKYRKGSLLLLSAAAVLKKRSEAPLLSTVLM